MSNMRYPPFSPFDDSHKNKSNKSNNHLVWERQGTTSILIIVAGWARVLTVGVQATPVLCF
jgi:hypothetical protein